MKVNFHNDKGANLSGLLYKPFRKTSSAALFCHGFAGYKEQFSFWARYFSFRGFLTLTFDFTGNGHSDGLFTDGTISQQVSDIVSAINFLKKDYSVTKVCLIGFSMGAASSVLASLKCEEVCCVIVLAPLAEIKGKPYADFANAMADVLDSKGLCDIVDCKKMRSLDIHFFHDLKKYDILNSVKELKVPLLVIHGSKDSLTSVDEGKALFNSANVSEKKIHIVDGADHDLGKGRFKISKVVLDWCRKYSK